MPTPLSVTQAAVRRFLLERQTLNTPKPARRPTQDDVFQLVSHLECVQLDPVSAVAPNQHLVLSTRLPGYQSTALEQLLAKGRVFEYWANAMCTIPMADYPLFEGTRRRHSARLQPYLDKLGSVVDEVLATLEREGPLPAKAFASEERVHGYWDNTHAKTKATSHALNLLHDTGRIQVVRREGTTRIFDLRERAVPKDLLERATQISDEEARTALLDKYIRAYRVFDASDNRLGWQPLTADERRQEMDRRVDQGILIPLQIEGVKRPYYILAEDVDQLLDATATQTTARRPRVHFLPPLDNLLWRRNRIEDLFGFSYTWEIYTPADKRHFGYYAMPILVDDMLIGRMDPRLDRKQKRLNLQLLQVEPHVRWTKALRRRVLRGLERFARQHGAELGTIERTLPEDLALWD